MIAVPIPPPPPMPSVRAALVNVSAARDALDRGCKAWRRLQVEDALTSAERFIAEARRCLNEETAA